jgi:hypothetical protein
MKTEIKLNKKNLKSGFRFLFTNEEGNSIELSFFERTGSFHLFINDQLKGSFKSFPGLKKATDKKIEELKLEFSKSFE